MVRKTRRVLTNEQWERLAPHLPKHPRSPKGGRSRADDRECLEGILWLLRTGARWRDLPVDMPSGSTCWRRLAEWSGEEVLQHIQALLIEELTELGELDLDELLADATFIRAKKGAMTSAQPRLAKA
ncbi:MAG: transposase [Pirellulales bacterium]|nr:transposase [Pirellulales bacterium]